MAKTEVEIQKDFWAYQSDLPKDTNRLVLLDNVQFIYELALAQLELASLGASYQITNGLREFKLVYAANLETLRKRLAYFKVVGGQHTDYFHIVRKNVTRSVNQYLTHWIYPYKGKFHLTEFGRLVQDVEPTSNGEWHINIFSKDGKYKLRVSKKGIFDVTPYLNYYDFAPVALRKGYIPQVQAFIPIKRRQEELEKAAEEQKPLSFKEALIKASKDSENPTEFERLIKQAFEKLGFEARQIGRAGDTDILISKPYSMIIDAKSTSKDSLSQIHFTRMKQHRALHNAQYMLVISVGFVPAVVRDAEIEGSSLMTVETLGEVLDLHEALPLSPFLLEQLFKQIGLLSSKEIAYLNGHIKQTQRYLSDVLFVVECIDYSPRTFEEIKGRCDYKSEHLRRQAISAETLKEILGLLSLPIFGIIKLENSRYSGFFNFPCAKERIQVMVKYLYNPANFHEVSRLSKGVNNEQGRIPQGVGNHC